MSYTVAVAVYSRFPAWNIPEAHVQRLRREFPEHRILRATNDEQALALFPEADIILMSELRPAHFAVAHQLKWVHSPAAGVGGMLFPEMVASDVVLTNSRGLNAVTIAEHVLAVTLVMFRKLPMVIDSQRRRHWSQDEALDAPAVRTISGTHTLVVGLGSIGQAVALRMSALGSKVTGIRRRVSAPDWQGITVEPTDRLLDLLPDADIVVLSLPQTRETRSLIGEREIAAMRRDALLVNVSRGKIVDERALIDALAGSRVGGAALDVFEHEPLAADSALWSLPNMLVTPHMSGFRGDHWDVVTDLFAENFRRFLEGKELLNTVDKQAGY